jgi:uncharacterized protein YcnI
LINEDVHSGEFEIMWNAGENPSGIYFIKLETENTSITRK